MAEMPFDLPSLVVVRSSHLHPRREDKIMQKIAIAGDWHGITEAMLSGMRYAARHGADAVIHVGDFAFRFSAQFLSELAEQVRISGVPIYFIRGNHDDRDYLDSFLTDSYSPAEIVPGVFYVPDGAVVSFGNTDIAFLGGAYSVDRARRVLGETWWENEEPDADAVQHFVDGGIQAPVMVVHELPRNALNVNGRHHMIETLPSREMTQKAIDAVRPKIVFNGHMHVRSTQDVRFTGEWDATFRLETLDKHDGDDADLASNIVFFDTSTHVVTAR